MKSALTAFIASIIICTEICSAQSVGIVMNGGGAKGLYHIGVLEALEQNGVPIDYIAGTSIGSIIGGLYAAGYSPAEMRELALSGELEVWVSGKIDRSLGAYVRRGSTLYKENPALSLRFDPKADDSTDSVARMPKSLISTTQIDMAMNELFAPATVASEGNFSKLMVPFLCVASDVNANKGVVFTQGDLGKSIRASMAIPLAFKPIRSDNGNLLYDGGMYDNFPWQPMQDEFNPDYIIGSVCGSDSWANTKDLSIADQAFLLAMEPSNYDITGNNTIIEREVPAGMLDFSKARETITMGYNDTMEKMDEILSHIDSTELKSEEYYTSRREEFRARSPKLIFDRYTISGLNTFQKEYALDFMSTTRHDRHFDAEEQKEITYDELRDNLYRILSENEFTTDYPNVGYDPSTERYSFDIEMEHKPSVEVAVSGYISSTQFNQLYLGVSYKTIKRVAQSLFSELYLGPVYTVGRVGYRADFFLRTPMFIDSYFNLAIKNLNRGSFGHLTHIDNSFGMKSSEHLFSVGIGAPLGQNSLALLRTNVGSSNYKYDNGLPTNIADLEETGLFYNSKFRYAAAKFELERSTINNLHYPTNGSLISLSAIGVTGSEKSFSESYTTNSNTGTKHKYEQHREWIGAKATLAKYYNISSDRIFTIGLSGEAVYTNIPKMSNTAATMLYMPSYNPIAHTQMVYMPELSARRYAAAGVMPSVKLKPKLYMQGQFHAMFRDTFDDETYVVSDGDDYTLQYISQASLIYETNLGPAALSLTKYNIENWDNLYLMISFGYPIFSPKGTFY